MIGICSQILSVSRRTIVFPASRAESYNTFLLTSLCVNGEVIFRKKSAFSDPLDEEHGSRESDYQGYWKDFYRELRNFREYCTCTRLVHLSGSTWEIIRTYYA